MPSKLSNNIPPTDFTKNCQGYYLFTANQIDLNILMRTSLLPRALELFFLACAICFVHATAHTLLFATHQRRQRDGTVFEKFDILLAINHVAMGVDAIHIQ